MLTHRQIRKLVQGFTDKQIVDQAGLLKLGPNFWSNGVVAFFEDTPSSLQGRDFVVVSDLTYRDTGVFVRPVELRGYATGQVNFKFVAPESGKAWWVDARYVRAGLKRVGRGKKAATFSIATVGHQEVLKLAHKGRTVMLLAIFDVVTEDDWEWKLVNREDR